MCNCDDPFESEFFKYFALNFNHLGLKKLICTSYAGSPISYTELDLNDLPLFHKDAKMPYMIEITQVDDLNNDGAEDMDDIELLLRNNENTLTILDGNGDFRSEECIGFLKEADIVVTNPPFSLFREFISLLIKYNKDFLIISNLSSITCKEVFPLVKNNQMWIGRSLHATKCAFLVPDSYEGKNVFYENGIKKAKVNNAIWLTNLDTPERHKDIILYKYYKEGDYPYYDNYDAIEVGRIADIPLDYDGKMGVPVTFLNKYNPDQFELLGIDRYIDDNPSYGHRFTINGKEMFARLIIKRRKNEN